MSHSKIIVVAGLIGLGIGMLLAPKKGTELQKSILDTIDELGEELGGFKDKIAGIAENLQSKVIETKDSIHHKVENVKDGVDDFKTTTDHIKTIFS